MHRPIITLCIPTFNRFDSLVYLLDRLQGEDSSIVKIMIGDNCSSDQRYRDLLPKLVDQHQLKVEIIRNNRNIGPLENFRNLAALSDTKYTALLGDDDFYLEKNAISQMARALEDRNLDYVYARTRYRHDRENPSVRISGPITQFELSDSKIENLKRFIIYHNDPFVYGASETVLLQKSLEWYKTSWRFPLNKGIINSSYPGVAYIFLSTTRIAWLSITQSCGLPGNLPFYEQRSSKRKVIINPKKSLIFFLRHLELTLDYAKILSRKNCTLKSKVGGFFSIFSCFFLYSNPIFGVGFNSVRSEHQCKD